MPAHTLTPDGLITGVRHAVSPNADARPDGERISLVVVHGISLPPRRFGGSAIEAFFTNRLDPEEHPYFATIADLRVSAHFLVGRRGRITQFVACSARAWHAGISRWRGRERCNDFSIGIELEGCDDIHYTAAQYGALARLVHLLRSRYPIVDIAGHSDVAPGRKSDPGPAFDWGRLLRVLGDPAWSRGKVGLTAVVASTGCSRHPG